MCAPWQGHCRSGQQALNNCMLFCATTFSVVVSIQLYVVTAGTTGRRLTGGEAIRQNDIKRHFKAARGTARRRREGQHINCSEDD
jgi:hypothetical protein